MNRFVTQLRADREDICLNVAHGDPAEAERIRKGMVVVHTIVCSCIAALMMTTYIITNVSPRTVSGDSL